MSLIGACVFVRSSNRICVTTIDNTVSVVINLKKRQRLQYKFEDFPIATIDIQIF